MRQFVVILLIALLPFLFSKMERMSAIAQYRIGVEMYTQPTWFSVEVDSLEVRMSFNILSRKYKIQDDIQYIETYSDRVVYGLSDGSFLRHYNSENAYIYGSERLYGTKIYDLVIIAKQ